VLDQPPLGAGLRDLLVAVVAVFHVGRSVEGRAWSLAQRGAG
jgi:hypothetical protein